MNLMVVTQGLESSQAGRKTVMSTSRRLYEKRFWGTNPGNQTEDRSRYDGEITSFTIQPTSQQDSPKRRLAQKTREMISRSEEFANLRKELRTLREYKDSASKEITNLKQTEALLSDKLLQKDNQFQLEVDELKKEIEGLKVYGANPEQARLIQKENERLNDDLRHYIAQVEKLKEDLYQQELNNSVLRKKMQILIESNDLKQKMLQEFEKKISVAEPAEGIDSRQIALLREFQAHRLQELYQKSRKHLEAERKQNDVLRKTVADTQNAELITLLKAEIATQNEELKELRRENQALKAIQHHHERQLLLLSDANQKTLMEDYAEEILRLRTQIARMEDHDRRFRHSGVGGKLGRGDTSEAIDNLISAVIAKTQKKEEAIPSDK
ncbi:hypothetical protein HDU76_000111 [Blyttiomyces sp. JEL0837]|nr:hypothetical protein HDU76_000111 [Blyttiomyces sp. JEL0837]